MFGISPFFHRTALRRLVVQRPSIASRRRLLETIFSVLSTSLLMQGLGGPGGVLSAFGLPRGASGRSRDGAPPTVIFRSLDQLRSNGRQLATVVDRVAAVRWNARMESSFLRSYASHLRMIAWRCRVFGIDLCRPDILGIRRTAACVNNYNTLTGWLSAWKAAQEALGQPCQVMLTQSCEEFVVALVACRCHVCRDSVFVEGCSVGCWYARFRQTILAGRGGPSSGSSPTPLKCIRV